VKVHDSHRQTESFVLMTGMSMYWISSDKSTQYHIWRRSDWNSGWGTHGRTPSGRTCLPRAVNPFTQIQWNNAI